MMKKALSILLVDDDETHQMLVARAIARSAPDFRVDIVGTGADCEAAVRNRDYDCVLLDFRLPDTTANILLRKLTDCQFCFPIIVTSSSREQAIVIESYRSGGVEFIPKEDALKDGVLRQSIEAAVRHNRRDRLDRRIAERRRRKLLRMAEADPLTGLYNRRYLDELLNANGRHTLDRRGSVSVIMIDIDHFKKINDRYGHPAGDSALRETSRIIRKSLLPRDIACRFGGEEFLLLLPQTSEAEAVYRAEQLRREIAANTIHADKHQISVTISLGVATCAAANFQETMINRADAALYLAKREGRNRVCVWAIEWVRRAIEAQNSENQPESTRFAKLLSRLWDDLGETQREHLTNHSSRVSSLAGAIGGSLGLPQRSFRAIRSAGLLHDVGKLAIPESVLGKPDLLTPQERRLVDRHGVDGGMISRWLGANETICDIVERTHERFEAQHASACADIDGSTLDAQIIAVADAFVAMTSDRAYQAAHPESEAFEEIQRERGRQFAPDVVDALVELATTTAELRPE